MSDDSLPGLSPSVLTVCTDASVEEADSLGSSGASAATGSTPAQWHTKLSDTALATVTIPQPHTQYTLWGRSKPSLLGRLFGGLRRGVFRLRPTRLLDRFKIKFRRRRERASLL